MLVVVLPLMSKATSARIIRRAVRVLSTQTASIASVHTTAAPSGDAFRLKLEPETQDYLKPPCRTTVDPPCRTNTTQKPHSTVLEEALKHLDTVRHSLRNRSENAESVVKFFAKAEVPPKKLLTSIERFPEILQLPITELESKIDRLLSHGLKRSTVFEILIDYPEVTSFDFDRDIQPIWSYLSHILNDPAAVIALIAASPVLLTYSLDLEIKPKIELLLKLGLDRHQIRETIESYPSVLSLSIEASIQPKFDYLHSRMPTMDVCQAIVTFPAFLDMSLECHIKEKVEFFLDDIEVDPILFARYLPYFPQIFSCEIEDNIKRKIEFLCLQMGITEGRGKHLRILKKRSLSFMACPSLFGFSIPRLTERIEQIRSLILRNDDVLDDLFVRCPLLFGCTVEIDEVEHIQKMIMNALSADRLAFLRILKTHPEILMTKLDTVEDVMETLDGMHRLEKVALLGHRQHFEAAVENLQSDKQISGI